MTIIKAPSFFNTRAISLHALSGFFMCSIVSIAIITLKEESLKVSFSVSMAS